MIPGFATSRVTLSRTSKAVSMIFIVFDDGAVWGKAEENVHSSSSSSAATAGAGPGVDGLAFVLLAKSNMEGDC